MRHVVGSAVLLDDVSGFLPSLHRIASIVSAGNPKHVFLIVPHFVYHATSENRRPKLAVMKSIPLGMSKYQNRNVLIRRAGLPLRMSERNHRSVPNQNLPVFGRRISLVVQLLNRNGITPPTGWQEKREIKFGVVIAKRQTGWLVWSVQATATCGQQHRDS